MKESANYHRWTAQETATFEANWRTMRAAELALETGHSLTSVQSRLSRLGLRLRGRTIPKKAQALAQKRAAAILRTAAAVPLAFAALGLMALAVLLAEGRDEVRRWWAAQ